MKIEACLTDDIARTLLIPLWCCATPCRANPRAAYDPVAVDVLKQLDFDFSEIRRSFKEYGQVCCLAREMNIDRTVRDFLARHPEGTIINLGCGLSTAVYRKPPTEAVWYDVDLPEVIRARQALLPPAKGHRLLARDIFDPLWPDAVEAPGQRGVLLLAAGVFHSQPTDLMGALLPFLSGRFPGGTLFFDAVSSLGMRISNRYVARSGNRNAPMTFCIDKVPALASLSPRFAAVSETPFFHGLPLSGLTLSTRVNIAIVQLFGMLKYVTIRFREFL